MQDPVTTRPITQRDLAKKLGVGLATVSMALRDDPRISIARRREIRAAARKLGYIPNPNAAALSHFRRPSVAGLTRAAMAWLNLWPHPEDLRHYQEFEGYWRGASAAARKFGYHLEEFSCGDPARVRRTEKILVARGITGILIPPHGGIPMDWGDFNWDRFSVVRLGRSVEQPAAHMVSSDHVANSLLAFNTIRDRGYDRVGFVTMAIPYHQFDAGYLKAQRFVPEQLRLPILNIHGGDPWKEVPKIEKWVKRERPDAIFTDLGVVPELLKEIGYHVPNDIGLAVTSILDANSDTGIDQRPQEIGRVAVLSLISQIHDNDRGIPAIPRQLLVKGRWVDGSTLPPHH